MSDIEDNARNLTYWWRQLNLSEEWDSMPRKMREDLLDKLHKALIDLENVNISKKDLQDLIILTDPPTVWDAILALERFPKNGKSKWEILAYLKATAIGIWKDQHPSRKPVRQAPPVKEKPIKSASWKTVQRWNLNNFRDRRCTNCGRVLQERNGSGLCRECQRNGKGSEH